MAVYNTIQLIMIPSANGDFIPNDTPANSSTIHFRYETGASRLIGQIRVVPVRNLKKSDVEALLES